MLFGGWGKCNYLADVHLLDLTAMRWRKVVPGGDFLHLLRLHQLLLDRLWSIMRGLWHVAGVPPETRRFHAMACLHETVYIYGGRYFLFIIIIIFTLPSPLPFLHIFIRHDIHLHRLHIITIFINNLSPVLHHLHHQPVVSSSSWRWW